REQKEEKGGSRVRWLSPAQLNHLGIRQALLHPPADARQPPPLRQPSYYTEHYLRTAYRLYELLIQPGEGLLLDKKALISVPHRILAYLPLEVLLKREAKRSRGAAVDFSQLPYLIHDYSIHYVPSASVWMSLKMNPLPKGTPPKELLAFGDPVY